MTAPAGVVDLSLPDYATLVARAGMNPDAEAARVASAAPADVRGAGTAFGRAGGELDSAFTASMGAQGSIGADTKHKTFWVTDCGGGGGEG